MQPAGKGGRRGAWADRARPTLRRTARIDVAVEGLPEDDGEVGSRRCLIPSAVIARRTVGPQYEPGIIDIRRQILPVAGGGRYIRIERAIIRLELPEAAAHHRAGDERH